MKSIILFTFITLAAARPNFDYSVFEVHFPGELKSFRTLGGSESLAEQNNEDSDGNKQVNEFVDINNKALQTNKNNVGVATQVADFKVAATAVQLNENSKSIQIVNAPNGGEAIQITKNGVGEQYTQGSGLIRQTNIDSNSKQVNVMTGGGVAIQTNHGTGCNEQNVNFALGKGNLAQQVNTNGAGCNRVNVQKGCVQVFDVQNLKMVETCN